MTEYIILRKATGDSSWTPVRNAGGIEPRSARSAKAAISALLDGEEEGGEYVAVPARSWKPVKVSVETQTKLKFG